MNIIKLIRNHPWWSLFVIFLVFCIIMATKPMWSPDPLLRKKNDSSVSGTSSSSKASPAIPVASPQGKLHTGTMLAYRIYKSEKEGLFAYLSEEPPRAVDENSNEPQNIFNGIFLIPFPVKIPEGQTIKAGDWVKVEYGLSKEYFSRSGMNPAWDKCQSVVEAKIIGLAK